MSSSTSGGAGGSAAAASLNQAATYLDGLIDRHPNLVIYLQDIKEDFQKKLWHQLTLKIASFIKTKEVKDSHIDFLEFYERFVKSFEVKLNQLSFVRLVVELSGSVRDINLRIQFVKSISELPKVKENNEANVNSKAILAELYVLQSDPVSLVQAKTILEEAKKILDETSGADAGVFGSFHRAWAAYYKIKGDYENFYSSALQYLGYTSLSSLESSEVLALARDLVVAALLGEKLFSLGELMENQILEPLKSSPEGWLVDILAAFNTGNLAAWKQLQTNYARQIANSPLRDKGTQLTFKVKILSLIELVFSKPSDQRTISFEVISKTSDVPLDQVELLVMRALSLELLKGIIDEVNKVVFFTWVQPRILNLQQISKMKIRLEKWVENVKQSLNLVENETTSELIS